MRPFCGKSSTIIVCGSVILLCSAFVNALAQSPATIRQFEHEKHIGTPEEAVVGIEVTNKGANGAVEILHANGVVLRCDGFILAPLSIFSGKMSDGSLCASHSAAVIAYPGSDHAVRLSARMPTNDNPAIGYVTIKVENVHIKALPALYASAVQPGDSLQVVYAAWDQSGRKFILPKTETVLPGKLPSDVAELKKLPLGSFPFSKQLESVPFGAVVVGPESKCIGIVSGGGTAHAASSFLGLEYLSLVTNCVAVVPTTDAEFESTKKDRDPGEMVDVQGGPVSTRWANSKDMQPDIVFPDTACVAPFIIDKYEVTNARYLAFWKSLTPAQQKKSYGDLYPSGWLQGDPPFGEDLANTPVLGVTQAGAMAYANWAGKRLVTPAEWCLAALGSKGASNPPDWVKKYIEDRNQTVAQIKKAHLDYVKTHPIMDAADFLPLSELPDGSRCDNDPNRIHGYNFVESWAAPWIANDVSRTLFGGRDEYGLTNIAGSPVNTMFDYVPRLYEEFFSGHFKPQPVNRDSLKIASWSKETAEQYIGALLDRWKDPGYVLPVGSREFDVSEFGVRDMVMNAKEVVLASPFAHASNQGFLSAMGVQWSEIGYPLALVDKTMQAVKGRQGAFVFGSGRDGLIVRSGDLLVPMGMHNTQFSQPPPPYGYDPTQTSRLLFVSPNTIIDYLQAPEVLPLSRLVERTTDWPPGDLILAAANLWHLTESMSQVTAPCLCETAETRMRSEHYYLWGGIDDEPQLDDAYIKFLLNRGPSPTNPVFPPKGIAPKTSPIGAPIGLGMWADQPWRYRKEIAIGTPNLSKLGLQGSLEGALNYVMPIGFRCAR